MNLSGYDVGTQVGTKQITWCLVDPVDRCM
jgi:hypothetical protein